MAKLCASLKSNGEDISENKYMIVRYKTRYKKEFVTDLLIKNLMPVEKKSIACKIYYSGLLQH